MKKTGLIAAGLILFLSITVSGAESFRVRSMSLVQLDSQKPEAQTIDLGYNDAIGILFPKNTTFIKGVEIEIKIPKDILSYRNSMAYGIFRQIQPYPSAQTIDYQAEQITLQALPSRLSFVLQLPLQKNHNMKTGPYSTVLSYIYDTSKGPLLFRILPIMKGLPENIEELVFSVKVKPVLTEEGGFLLHVVHPQETIKPISIRVDEVLVTETKDTLILSPGTHHLSVVSDDYRNEVRMFTVESAKITELSVTLQDTTPRLYLAAPENARIYFDGNLVENTKEARAIEAGEHTIKFMIGDYEMTKQIVVEKGRDYTVSMLIDINITESP